MKSSLTAALGCLIITTVTGCAPKPPLTPMDRYRDAKASLTETIASYNGKTHAELQKKIDTTQDSRDFRKRGHSYEVIVAVSPDVEHQPDGLQVSFTVFDGDEPAVMSPVTKTIFLRSGQSIHSEQ